MTDLHVHQAVQMCQGRPSEGASPWRLILRGWNCQPLPFNSKRATENPGEFPRECPQKQRCPRAGPRGGALRPRETPAAVRHDKYEPQGRNRQKENLHKNWGCTLLGALPGIGENPLFTQINFLATSALWLVLQFTNQVLGVVLPRLPCEMSQELACGKVAISMAFPQILMDLQSISQLFS